MSNIYPINQHANAGEQEDSARGTTAVLWRRVVEVLTAIGDAAMSPTPPEADPRDCALVTARRASVRLHRRHTRSIRARKRSEFHRAF
jgi:hypothetical protein